VRSLGGVIGHVADGNNLLCGMASGDKAAPNPVNEKKTTRADLVAALKASFAACDKVFAATTDANATAPVDFFGQKQTRLGMLAFTKSHIDKNALQPGDVPASNRDKPRNRSSSHRPTGTHQVGKAG